YICIGNVTADKTLTPEKLKAGVMNMVNGFTAPNALQMIFLAPFAMLLAINGFHYLHSKSRVDLMHSLPVSRGRIFRIILGNDLAIFLVPYLASLLVEIAYVQYLGYMGKEYMTWLVLGLVFSILIFLMYYLLMTFCMVITGQTFVSILAFGVFVLYVPMFVNLNLTAYSNIFFKTFCSLSAPLSRIINCLSPGTAGYMLASHYTMIGHQLETGPVLPYVVAVLWIAVLLVVSYLAFIRYPSERAGSAMVHRRGKKLIKLMIVVPLAMFTGLLFYEITMTRSYVWLYFGVVFGVLLFHGIVECIYQFDIRGLWSKKVDLIFITVATVLCVLCFDVDILKYDERVPDATKVSSVKVTEYYGYDTDDFQGIPAENAGKLLEILNRIAGEVATTGDQDKTIQVTYYSGNGKMTERKYAVLPDTYEALENELYSLKDYKKMIYGIYSMEAGKIISVFNNHPLESTALNLNEDQKKELLEIRKEETDALSYQEMTHEQPVTSLSITYQKKETDTNIYPEGYSEVDETYDIFPSYKKTIAFLKEQKCVIGATAADCEISQIVLSRFVGEADDGSWQYENYTIKDEAFINSVKDKLYFSELNAMNIENVNFTENSYVTAKIGRVDYDLRADSKTLAIIYNKAVE
ncbi:MAG: hypothetical protein IKX76_06670, partial [Eubacterium sp.]|nr:hypothetical protein [Eubacterium sp.]